MNRADFPLLAALESRGPACFQGEPLAWLRVEVRGGRLHIAGAAPLRDDGTRYTALGAEYRYRLEPPQAEALLRALARRSPLPPERVIARQFEFSRPDRRLKDYLDGLHIPCHYEYTKGEPL